MAQKGVKMVNIPRSVTDEFYRYKMPDLIAKVEGRGNGIKTVIVNMSDIAHAIHRPPSYITKYFGFELGALTTIKGEADRYVVNGNHSKTALDSVLDSFIKKYVLCSRCLLPETNMVFTKSTITMKCAACGNAQQVATVDKIGTYMLKNSSVKSTEPEKGSRSEGKKASNVAAPTVAVAESDTIIHEHSSSLLDWSDTSAASVERRRAELIGAGSKAMDLITSAPAAPATTAEKQAAVEAAIAKVSVSDPAAVASALTAVKRALSGTTNADIVDHSFVQIFGAGPEMRGTIIPRAAALSPFLQNDLAAQNTALNCVANAACEKPELMKVLQHVLAGMYEADLIGEEAVLAWYEELVESKDDEVVAAARPFVEWLKNAEEDDE